MLSLDQIKRTQQILAPVAFHTPLTPSPHLGALVGAQIFLKLENLQRTGSFKIRGAYNRLHSLAQSRPGAKVAAASAGNHAQGVALSAKLLGLEATIFMPHGVALSKREATASNGAQVRLFGENVEQGLAAARELGPDYTLVHPYDDELVIAGQATLGLEIIEDFSDAYAVLVPVGGGGLIAGVAAAIKQTSPSTLVVGVEPSRAASARAALDHGGPVTVDTEPTLADGARIARLGDLTYPLIQRYVDEVVQVREEHISQAMLLLMERRRIVAEGAGALGLAALIAGAAPGLLGKKLVLLISGGNVDSNLLGRIINQGLVRSGRIFRFSVVISDRPGFLAGLLEVIADSDANVLDLHHDRLSKDLPPDLSKVVLEVETRGPEHAEEIGGRLKKSGFDICAA